MKKKLTDTDKKKIMKKSIESNRQSDEAFYRNMVAGGVAVSNKVALKK